MRAAGYLIALSLLMPLPAAAQLQSDCRGSGTIGDAFMSQDGTVTLTLHSADGTYHAVAYHKNDPRYARVVSHLGGIRPGEHKPVPSFC